MVDLTGGGPEPALMNESHSTIDVASNFLAKVSGEHRWVRSSADVRWMFKHGPAALAAHSSQQIKAGDGQQASQHHRANLTVGEPR